MLNRTKKFWIVFTCLVCSSFFLLFQGGKLAFMLFAVVCTLVLYLLLGRWSGIASIAGSRVLLNQTTTGDIEAGTSLQVEIHTRIPGFWPIPYILVKDNLIRRNGSQYLFETAVVPDWFRKGVTQYVTPALRRGLYHFEETACSTEDIFGLFEHKGTLQIRQSFRVLPKTINIKDWKQLHQMLRGAHHHSANTRASKETTQINGVREYIYGDRISRIHWKTTARTGTWKSKEFEREALPKTMIVLDRNESAYENAEQFEKAVSMAASLIQYGFNQDLALGLMSKGKDSVYFETKSGDYHQKIMMNHLIDVEADGQQDLSEVLQHHSEFLSKGLFLLIISPINDTTKLLQTMNWIKRGQMTPCFMWVTPHDEQMGRKEWSDKLRSKGHYGYAIQTLQELPWVLGGRSS